MFFLPAFGYLLLVMWSGLFLLYNWQRVKEMGWGDKRIVGCLLFIVLCIALSGTAYNGLQDRFAPLGMGLALFALYLTGMALGKDIFLPLAIGTVLACSGIIAHAICYPGELTGGFVFEKNYDIATGYILMGTALCTRRYRRWLIGLSLIALFLSGSPEAVFAIGVVAVVMLIRRDFTWRYFYPVAIPCTLAIVWFGLGYGTDLYRFTGNILSGQADALSVRFEVIREAMSNIRPLGEGFNLTAFTKATVHNVPLIIVQQLGWAGILAGMAWLWVSIYSLVRMPRKYTWVLILALSVFDHYIWTQLAPLWWVIVGVSGKEQIERMAI